MPIMEIDALDKGSSDAQVSAAISACIQAEMNSGMEQDQAQAMCIDMARGKTGKGLAPKEGS